MAVQAVPSIASGQDGWILVVKGRIWAMFAKARAV